MHEQPKCANPSCRCSVPRERAAKGDPYCSEWCASHAEEEAMPTSDCACGHPACGGGA